MAGNPDLPAEDIEGQLTATAVGLGEPGHDAIFSVGLLAAIRLCRQRLTSG
jgi:hypothetical protein